MLTFRFHRKLSKYQGFETNYELKKSSLYGSFWKTEGSIPDRIQFKLKFRSDLAYISDYISQKNCH